MNGTADIPEGETREQDLARQRRETADATRAAEMDAKWQQIADAQVVLLRLNEGKHLSDEERTQAVNSLISGCELLRRR